MQSYIILGYLKHLCNKVPLLSDIMNYDEIHNGLFKNTVKSINFLEKNLC